MSHRLPVFVLLLAFIAGSAACGQTVRPAQNANASPVSDASDMSDQVEEDYENLDSCNVDVEIHYDLNDLTGRKMRKVFRRYEEGLIDDIQRINRSLDSLIVTYARKLNRKGPDALVTLGVLKHCSEAIPPVVEVMDIVAKNHNAEHPEYPMTFEATIHRKPE